MNNIKEGKKIVSFIIIFSFPSFLQIFFFPERLFLNFFLPQFLLFFLLPRIQKKKKKGFYTYFLIFSPSVPSNFFWICIKVNVSSCGGLRNILWKFYHWKTCLLINEVRHAWVHVVSLKVSKKNSFQESLSLMTVLQQILCFSKTIFY